MEGGGEEKCLPSLGDLQGISLRNMKCVSHLTMEKHFFSFFL